MFGLMNSSQVKLVNDDSECNHHHVIPEQTRDFKMNRRERTVGKAKASHPLSIRIQLQTSRFGTHNRRKIIIFSISLICESNTA